MRNHIHETPEGTKPVDWAAIDRERLARLPDDLARAPDGRTWYELALAEAERRGKFRDALVQIAADWQSSPGTVMGAAAELGREFKRRQQIAADALSLI